MASSEEMKGRVLVVDDEPDVSASIGQVLSMDHYEVETVTSGQEALQAFQKGKYALIIIDYEMPVMKGDKLAAAIKALSPEQPILILTAYSEVLRFAGSFPLAVDCVIGKPFAVSEFRETVRRLADQPSKSSST